MATGDVVSNVTVDSYTFQPAAGVNICISQFISDNYNNVVRGRGDIDFAAYDMEFAFNTNSNTNSIRWWNLMGMKFFISNTAYLYFFNVAGRRSGFSGIQL